MGCEGMKVKNSLLIVIALVVAFIGVASAEEMILYDVNMSDYDDVPNGFFVGKTSGLPSGVSIAHNDTLDTLDVYTTSGNSGGMYVTGLTPATSYNLTFEIGSDNNISGTCLTNIHSNIYRFHIQKKASSYEVRFRYDTNTFTTIPFSAIEDNKFRLSVICDGVNETVTLKFNDTYQASQGFMNNASEPPYTTLLSPTLYIYSTEQAEDSENWFHIYSITQSIPKDTVTCYGTRDYFGIGGDYLRELSSQNGANYLHVNGGYGTIWADVGYPEQQAYISSLLANGWEPGIHFSQRLTDLSEAEAEALIDSEVATITALYGQTPTCWCSLENADNATHAAYIYTKYGMTWRNGQASVSYPYHGLYSSSWAWVGTALDNGLIHAMYTHGTDFADGAAQAYTTDYPDFTEFVDSCNERDVKIVGFSEYYFRNTNQKDAVVSISKNDASEIAYTLITNGYPTALTVDSNISGFVIKAKNGVTEQIYNTAGIDSFKNQTSGNYRIYRIPFSITGVDVNATVDTWTAGQKVWTLSSSDSTATATHVIGGFPANTHIDIYRDGVDYATVRSNSTGYITWVYDGGFSEHTFEARVDHTAGIRSSFVNSWSNTVSMIGAIIVIALAGSMIMMFRGKKDLSEVMNDLPGILLIVVLLVTGAIIFGQF